MKDPSDALVTLATKHRGLDRMPVGTQFGRYVMLDLQGAGGMGVVYSAYDPKLDRRVASKLLRSRSGGALPREIRAWMAANERWLATGPAE